jgi:hypothetical protein
MSTSLETRDRDPVAIAIEGLLFEMQNDGIASIRKSSEGDSIVLRFGALRSEGKTLDIALVRLASAMMDDRQYAKLLMEALHEPMKAEAA